MKAMTSLMLAAVFTLMLLPAQASTVSANSGIVIQTLSMGDGVDNRQCRLLEKQGKELPGFCGP
ncbi:hypothetical protein [Oceanisphaera sp. IT1-181]|uniref:hypothetical protein n=1 Tax=Oceanisphaera sp. IT1-181 TaxID=3081199 RepID=UPI0029C9C4BE|nr:hypothetical protein [Oceanisphaera sp. IT1-181]